MPQAKIIYSRKFEKQLQIAPRKIIEAFRARRILFIENPLNPQLRNHELTGKLKGYRSINITGDWRVLYSIIRKDDLEIIYFEAIGTHSQLYK